MSDVVAVFVAILMAHVLAGRVVEAHVLRLPRVAYVSGTVGR
jgi:hypothetical protein